MLHRRSTSLRVEPLETRDAPAALNAARTTLTYQDIDGDTVKVVLSKPIPGAMDPNNIFKFSSGAGAVNGNTLTAEQLWAIDLTSLGVGANGMAITMTAVRHPVNKGDGFAAVGEINATGIDLGPVTIDGDLGKVVAGDATTTTSGLKGLTAQSMGRFGLSTGAGTSTGVLDLLSTVQGKLDFLKVKADVKEASFNVLGGVDGKIGSVTIGGSLIGRGAGSTGRIFSDGDMGFVTIGGNLIGGSGTQSGIVYTTAKMAGVKIGGSVLGGGNSVTGSIVAVGDMGFVTIGGTLIGAGFVNTGEVRAVAKLAGVKIAGSVQGGLGQYSGKITSGGDMGLVTIGGNLTGGGGTESGEVISNGKLAGVKIGGSVQGGTGPSSGRILGMGGDMGPVTIGGNFTGGTNSRSGEMVGAANLASLKIGGSVLGGTSDGAGRIAISGNVGPITIGGDVIGGSASGGTNLDGAGYILSGKRIACITLGGSLIAGTNTGGSPVFQNNGAIEVRDDLGSVLIKGSVIGNATHPAIISARGKAGLPATATTDLAIGKLSVLGRVEFGQILGGVNDAGVALNADAQIGPVSIGGDWIASTLETGMTSGADLIYGTPDDLPLGGGVATIFSKITSLTIGGQAMGTVGGVDNYAVVAQHVGAVKIGGTTIPLTPGNSNDLAPIPIGITAGDFTIREI
jgi:hypothetical protein